MPDSWQGVPLLMRMSAAIILPNPSGNTVLISHGNSFRAVCLELMQHFCFWVGDHQINSLALGVPKAHVRLLLT